MSWTLHSRLNVFWTAIFKEQGKQESPAVQQACQYLNIIITALNLIDFIIFGKGHKHSQSEYQLNDYVLA